MSRGDADQLASDVLNALSGIVYVYDLVARRNVFIGAQWQREFGYSIEDVQGDSDTLLARIVHPDDMPRVTAHHTALRHAADNAMLSLEYRVRRSDGSYAWLSSVDRPFRRGTDGLVASIVGHAHDISAQKKAEVARAESDARFRSIVEHLPDAVFIVGSGLVIREVNDAACAQLGYPRHELLGMKITDIVAPEHHERVHERLSTRSGSATASQSEHIRKDGTRVPVETVVLAFAFDGETMFMGVARDISDRLQLEAQLREAHRMESIGRLAGAVAHDFNNMLSAILAGASLLEQGTTTTPEQRTIAAEIVAVAGRGAELTRQLLTAGRRQRAELAALDLAQQTASTLAVVRRLLDPAITVETELAANCHVLADATMIDQLVMDLVLNARDAMPRGGTLRIVVAPEATDDATVCLHVSDTGIGIDAAELPRIFEPFFTTKPGGEASGIGLAAVYGIVTQHGGRIGVDSAKGVGTTFRITLPRTSDTPRPSAAPAAIATTSRGLGVLLVEDMDPVRAMVTRLLTRKGHRVVAVSSAAAAFEIWSQQQDFDVLLSDVSLGAGTDGRQLADRLREDRPDLFVVLMSGFAPQDMETAPRYRFLQKPFRTENLDTLLKTHFDSA